MFGHSSNQTSALRSSVLAWPPQTVDTPHVSHATKRDSTPHVARYHLSQLLYPYLSPLSLPIVLLDAVDDEDAALIMVASSPLQERPRLQPVQSGFRRSVTLVSRGQEGGEACQELEAR